MCVCICVSMYLYIHTHPQRPHHQIVSFCLYIIDINSIFSTDVNHCCAKPKNLLRPRFFCLFFFFFTLINTSQLCLVRTDRCQRTVCQTFLRKRKKQNFTTLFWIDSYKHKENAACLYRRFLWMLLFVTRGRATFLLGASCWQKS